MIKAISDRMTAHDSLLIADTFTKRFAGYMLRKKPHYEAILFKPCSSIHTFLMKFDIDVLFLNKDMKVIKKVEALKPGKIVMPVKDAVIVMEAEAGKFKHIDIGYKLVLYK